MKNYCYKDGKILTADKLFVSVYDIGLLRGYAIFDSLTVFKNKPFYLKEHLTRFKKSATKIGLKVPLSDSEITGIIDTLVRKNKFERTNIKMVLTGGKTIQSIEYDRNNPTFFILAEEWHALPEQLYTKGGKLITKENLRFAPEIKTTHYITAVELQAKRKKEKAIEILYTSGGNVLECSASNVCMFKDNVLITPKNNILFGITRQIALKLAKKYFKIEERDVTVSEFLKADEIFITASFKDIMPIVQIDNHTIGDGKVGPNTKKLMELFTELTKK